MFINIEELAKLSNEALEKEYPDAICSLQYKSAFELLVATRLAAQCTDNRVNIVTPDLFKKYRTVYDLAKADREDVEECIRSCGFYKIKSKDLIEMSKMIVDKYNGEVPDNMEDLLSLPGVGRKTANLILGDIFNKPAVVVDTHCIRITRRLGFHDTKNPEKIEKILRNCLDSEKSNDFCHRLVLHGRKICKAQKPLCNECTMNSFCKYYNDNKEL